MPTFYDKMFKPKKSRLSRSQRNEWGHWSDTRASCAYKEFEDPVSVKDVENFLIRQLFKTKKKSLANQKLAKKETK